MSLNGLKGSGKLNLKSPYRLGNFTPSLNTGNTGNISSPSSSPSLTYARVKDVCTSPDHPLYNTLGIKSLGAVVLQNISSNILTGDEQEVNYSNSGLFIAFPLFPNIKNYPLKGEIVITLFAPNFTSQNTPTNVSSYYICPANIWNNTHHNALPDTRGSEENQSITTNETYYNDIPSNEGSTEIGQDIELGDFFTESEYIKNLLPYEGDIIYEGRFGNSIRFSSTNRDTNINNNWSEAGDNGDPLTIIRVKKFTIEDASVGLEETPPALEDINNDDSSIWITSTQKIPIDINFL